MNSKRHPRLTASSRRRRVAGIVAVAALGLSACNSDPGARRVAEDIVDTALVNGEISQETHDCLFAKIDAYTDAEYKAIQDAADQAGPGTALDLFEADLAECN